ncbi:hypothetical protein L7F22_007858 [Adiantum nelumboides]|nr:hypothetical protein [Adiantum nelumboides]
MLEETFVRSWRVRFSNLHLLAVLVADLQAYHPDFAIHVIDTVCEQMHVGMETNIFSTMSAGWPPPNIWASCTTTVWSAAASSLISSGLSSPLVTLADDHCPPVPMDVDFMLADTLETLRPKFVMSKSFDQAHDVQVPADSAIAVNSRANERQQLAERQQLKKLVLGYEGRDDQDRAAMDASLARRTFRSNK